MFQLICERCNNEMKPVEMVRDFLTGPTENGWLTKLPGDWWARFECDLCKSVVKCRPSSDTAKSD